MSVSETSETSQGQTAQPEGLHDLLAVCVRYVRLCVLGYLIAPKSELVPIKKREIR